MKVTVVMDNLAPNGSKQHFLAEHGLSLLLETDSQARLLLDAGQSAAVLNNLHLLEVAPASIEAIMLSHGHYDHAGGLYPLLKEANEKIPLYAHPGIFASRFAVSAGVKKYIGVPYRQEQLASLGAEWRFVDAPMQLEPGLWLSGPVPRITEYELGDTRFAIEENYGVFRPDGIDDDMSIYHVRGNELVVIGGCAHSGLVNTVRHGFAVTGATRLAGWIGGTHLGPVGEEQQQKTIAALQAWQPDFVAANHCTGFNMMAVLRGKFGAKFIPASIGTVIEW